MILTQYNDKQKSIPEGWHEVTLEKILLSVPVLKEMPKDLYKAIYRDHRIPKDKGSMQFYKKWIAFWLDLTEQDVGRMSAFDNGQELGIVSIFNLYLAKFLYHPDEKTIQVQNEFEFNGVTYRLPGTTKDTIGNLRSMPKSSFDEYVDSVLLLSRIGDNANDFQAINLLMAVLFRPVENGEVKPYDSNEMEQRAEQFKKVTMDKVWSAYFFLQRYNLELSGNSKIQYLLNQYQKKEPSP